jgi:hypothetical protein
LSFDIGAACLQKNLQIVSCDIRILIMCVEITHGEEVSRNAGY